MCNFCVNGRPICYTFHDFQNVPASCERSHGIQKKLFLLSITLKTGFFYCRYLPIFSIGFNNLSGLNWLFLLVDMGDFLQKAFLSEWAPLNRLVHPLGKLAYPPKRIARANVCSSHCYQVKYLRKLLMILPHSLRFLKGNFPRKSLVKSELSD